MSGSESDSLKFPFLGTLDNGEPFEYLLLSIDTVSAKIALLQWFLNRLQLHIGEKISLHLPYVLSTEYRLRGDISGTVIAAKHSEENQGKIYQVSLSNQKIDSADKHNVFDQYAKQIESEASLTELLIHLLKDSMLLKSGIRVYFKHLIPYFSRIADYSHKEYSKLEMYFLHDIESRISDNVIKLEKLHKVAQEKITKPEEIAIYIDLEFLRETLESEISLSVFNVVFSEDKKPDLSAVTHPQHGIFMYINAIKSLERRLYSNYNHIVIIYLKSIASKVV